jgi:hypothetical protein
LVLFSFLDAEGKELEFTTTDPNQAQDHAARHRLAILRNHYEFVTSEPVADCTGNPQAPAERQRQPAPHRRAKEVPAPVSPPASAPTREEVLALLARLYHQRLGHDVDCPCLHGGACGCLRREIGQALAAAGLQP